MGFGQIFGPHLVLLLIATIYFANATELVPVYIWQTSASNGLFPAVAHINQDTFKEILLQKQGQQQSERLIVFAEQNLSPEDFSNNDKNTFHELATLAESNRVTYLPTVATPIEGIKQFALEIKSVSINDIANDIKLLENTHLIIDLNDARDDEDRTAMLRRHAQFISEVYKKLTTIDENVIAVYTGYHSSWIIPNEIRKQRRERSAETDDKPMITNTEHFLFYINGMFEFTDENGAGTNITVTKVEEISGTLTLTTDKEPIVITLKNEIGYWYIPQVKYGSKLFPAKFYAPDGFSYSCSSADTLKVDKEYLKFPIFQVQYFSEGKIEDKKIFYDSYDCVGFTTAPIWSGLFVTLILAIIMALGLTMIMDIKTMDRFDDPKGKTISINAGE